MSVTTELSTLVPLEKSTVQVYFSNRIQLAQVIEWCLNQIGCADMDISTFSTSEEFIRRLWRLKKNNRIGRCTMFCDLKASRKTVVLYSFMKSVFDRVALCQNHSKAVLLTGAGGTVAIVTSQNQTRGDRFECGVITSDIAVINKLREGFDALLQKSLPIESLIEN